MVEQLSIFDASGAPLAPLHAAGRHEPQTSAARPKVRGNAPTPSARRTDPDTSHAAAHRAQVFAASHHGRILAALDLGPGNIYELAERTGIDRVAIARRLPELERMNEAAPTQERRDGARVWRRA